MAAGATYTPIATTTLGSAASSYTFSSIPSTYTDLIIVVQANESATLDGVTLQFNGSAATNYSATRIAGNGTTASSDRDTNETNLNLGIVNAASNATNIFQIMNYANSTTYKTVLARGNASGSLLRASVGLWRSTAAINSIKVMCGGGTNNFTVGSTFTLYGIAAA